MFLNYRVIDHAVCFLRGCTTTTTHVAEVGNMTDTSAQREVRLGSNSPLRLAVRLMTFSLSLLLFSSAMPISAFAFSVPIPPGQSQTISVLNRDAAFSLACHTTGGLFGTTDCTSASDPPVSTLFSGGQPTGRDVVAQNQTASATSSAARLGNAPLSVGAPDGAAFAKVADQFGSAEGRVLLNYIATDRSATLGGDGLIAVRVAGATGAALGGQSQFRLSVYQEPIFFIHNDVTFNFVTGDIQSISGGPCGGNAENLGSMLCVIGQHTHLIDLNHPNDPINVRTVTVIGPGSFTGSPTVQFQSREGDSSINEEFVVGVRIGTPFTVDLDVRTNGPGFAGIDPIVTADPQNPNLIVQRVEIPPITGSVSSLLNSLDVSDLPALGIDVDTSVFSSVPPDQTGVPEPATVVLVGTATLLAVGAKRLRGGRARTHSVAPVQHRADPPRGVTTGAM
jgi:hypothetical protein